MTRDSFLLFVALSVAIIAAAFDLQQHRIPNWLTYPAILLGFALRGALLGWTGLLSGLAGFFLAGGVIFLFFLVRAMGAGDVKLMAAIGAFAGLREAGAALLATAICGGVLAIVYALYRRRLWTTFKNVGVVMKFHAWAGAQAHPELNLDNPAALRIPYGLAISLGTLYTLVAIWRR
jgi:prepilin peptidase CpaA